MGLSRRVKYKFKFTRKYNTNVYDFFTKKKSTRKVFEEKYLTNFLAMETESLKVRLSMLIQKTWFETYRRQNKNIKKKKVLKTSVFFMRKKARTLFLVFFYAYKKFKKQQKIFLSTKEKNCFFSFYVNSNFFFRCYKVFLNFRLNFDVFSLEQLKIQKDKQIIISKFTKFFSFSKELKNFLTRKNFGSLKKKQQNVYLSKQRLIAMRGNPLTRSNMNNNLVKARAVLSKLQNVFLVKKHVFNSVCNKIFKDRKYFLLLSRILKRKIAVSVGLKPNFKKYKRVKLWVSLRKVKKNQKFLFFVTENKKTKYKKSANFVAYKYEAFETAWFFYDLLQNFFLYEKLKSKIFSEYKRLFVAAFPFFSFKMQKFLFQTFFRTKGFTLFKYNQRAPRVFEYFFTRLQQKYGFKAMDVPFRLDVPLPRYKIKKQSEKVEMYKLLKVTRRNYGHLTRKVFWKIRKKVYNKTKGYAFFNQLLFYESRLDIFLIRAQLCDSLQESRGFISKGWICVNGRQIYNLNYVVTLMDIVSVFSGKMLIFKHFFLNKCFRLLNEYSTTIGKIFPKYLESNYLNMSFCYVPKVFSVEKIPGQFSLNKTMVTNWGKFAY